MRDRSLPPPEGLGPASPCVRRGSLTTSWREVAAVVARNWRVALSIEGGLLLVCLAYCLVAPNQYEASAKVALRTAPTSMLSMEGSGAQVASILSAPLQQETLANFLRSDRLAWRVILDLKLYQDAGFQSDLARRFPEFRAETPTAEARAYRGLKLETAKGVKRVVLLFAERAAAWCAQSVLCNSPSMLAEALALRLAPAGKIRLIGDGSSNGVDVERFSPGPSTVRGALGIADDAEVVGFVGRLTRDKGVPELLEAFEKILFFRPRARLLLVGWFDMAEDALDAECKDRIANHPKIHCPGFVVDTAPYYRAMDVMVLRTWREGFPNVALEAEATEIPVITTESTEARDSIVPDVTGLLIPRGSPDAISDAVLKLLRDAGLRLHMGAAGRMWVSLNFADKRVLRLAVSYYRSLIGFGTAHGVGGDAQAGSPA